MVKFKSIFAVLLICAAFSSVSCRSSPPDTDVLSVDVLTRNEGAADYELHTEIPAFDSFPELTAAIADTAAIWEADFRDSLEALRSSGSQAPASFIITWQSAQMNGSLISILLRGYSYAGGANGQQLLASFCWDAASGSWLALENIFSMGKEDLYTYLSDVSRESLASRLVSGEDAETLLDMICLGTEPTPDNFAVFTVSPFYITLYFNKYQVAPGAAGIQSVDVPLPPR